MPRSTRPECDGDSDDPAPDPARDGRAVGLENLPTEPGQRLVFAELAAEYRSRKG